MRPNMFNSSTDPTSINLTNTNTGKTVTAEVAHRDSKSITVYLGGEKITLFKKNELYIGNKFGMELVYKP